MNPALPLMNVARVPGMYLLFLCFAVAACSKAKVEMPVRKGDSTSAPAHSAAASKPAPDSSVAEKPIVWKTHKGPYFDAKYPATFTDGSTREEDGAIFTSPDKAVQFYIYSPQWNGVSTVYAADSARVTADQRTTERSGSRIVTRATFKSADERVTRAYEDVQDTLYNTRRIFGIFYSSDAAYAGYKDMYLTFKRSLRQYGD